jgi:hypothetical protein
LLDRLSREQLFVYSEDISRLMSLLNGRAVIASSPALSMTTRRSRPSRLMEPMICLGGEPMPDTKVKSKGRVMQFMKWLHP